MGLKASRCGDESRAARMSRPPVTRDFLAKGTASVLSGRLIVNTCAERSNGPVRAKIGSDSALQCRSDASVLLAHVTAADDARLREKPGQVTIESWAHNDSGRNEKDDVGSRNQPCGSLYYHEVQSTRS